MDNGGLYDKIFPLQVTRRIFYWMIVVIIIPTLILAIVMPYNFYQDERDKRVQEIKKIATILNIQLVRSFSEILEAEDAVSQSLEVKVTVLNSMLQPFVDQISNLYPHIGMGYYSIKIDRILAIGPNFDPSMLIKVSRNFPHFKSYETGQPELIYSNSSFAWKGKPIINYTVPIFDGDEIVGHTWANIKMEDVYFGALVKSGKILLTGLFLVLEMVFTVWLIFTRLQQELGKFAQAVVDSRSDLEPGLFPELDPLLSKINEHFNKLARMEGELFKATKLDSLALMAGGIAHDFNNLLTVIMGHVSLAKMKAFEDKKLLKNLEETEKAAFQAKDLTKQLLNFAKGKEPVVKVTDLREIINETINLILSGSHVACEIILADDLAFVEVDEGQIKQVFNNLIINASQAMPDGGAIKISLENITIEEYIEAIAVDLQPGNYVKISIIDEGIGIPAENLPKIFDPYFTSKQDGNGLGLATSYSIIKNHGGYISAQSEVGTGTTFCICLPAAENSAKLIPEVEKKSFPGRGSILVMDDDRAIAEVLSGMLHQLGCRADYVKDGDEAIETYRQALEAGCPYDLVIMDLTIPGAMGGKKAVTELLKLDPAAKVIVSSGYANDPVMTKYQDYGFRGSIGKPFNLSELAEVLAGVLAA